MMKSIHFICVISVTELVMLSKRTGVVGISGLLASFWFFIAKRRRKEDEEEELEIRDNSKDKEERFNRRY